MTESKLKQPHPHLIEKCIKGDVRSFRELMGMYQNMAFSIAFRIVCNEEDARDIVQNAFIKIWRNLKNFKKEMLFTTWLYRIVINLCYDHQKTAARRKKALADMYSNVYESKTIARNDISQQFENQDLAERIKELANGLTVKQKMVFILRDIEELSVREAAEILKISEGAVKTNLYLARASIREKYFVTINSGGYENELW